MPDRFDLLKVIYIDSKDTGLCFAPYMEIKDGDTVETALGRAFVVDRECFVSKDNKIVSMLEDVVPIQRVLFKIKPIQYEVEE